MQVIKNPWHQWFCFTGKTFGQKENQITDKKVILEGFSRQQWEEEK
jgi:hypothetical protein